jgi:peptidoglycan/LPS O-acetylase OafA/YrhL
MAEAMGPPDSSRRIPQLDGLRGVAIAMVLVYHLAGGVAGIQPQFPALIAFPINFGWSGVDLFFVLSGFLIGGILLDARQSPNYFRVFYRRRVCRIFPMYFASLAAYLLAVHFVQAPETPYLLHPVIPWQATVTFMQNFWMAFRNQPGAWALAPTWSLAVEEQFYLTLPALIYFVKPERLVWVLTGGIILAPLIRLAIFLANPKLIHAMAFLLPCRMDSLLFGVLIAYFLRKPGAWDTLRAHRRHLWTAVEVLTVLCVLMMAFRTEYSAPVLLVGYDLLALLFSGILLLALLEDSIAGLLRAKWLMALGTISYCVYLIHELVFGMTYLALKPYTTSWAATVILTLVLIVIIAKLSWEYFEKPLVKFGHRAHYLSGGPVAAASTGSTAEGTAPMGVLPNP